MQNERYVWAVCLDRESYWEYLPTCETRAEAEAKLRVLHAVWPNAFLVRATLTRIDRSARPRH